MNLNADRLEISEILDTVDGVHGKEYRPTNFSTGDAWPQLGPLERGPGFEFEVTWRVVVILPVDERKASEWFGSHLEDITDALESFAVVERVEPFIFSTGESDGVNAMQLTMRKEA